MIQLYQDSSLTVKVPTVLIQGSEFHKIRLPRNSPGNVSRTVFYLFNETTHFLENVEVIHGSEDMKFLCEERDVAPKGVVEIIAEWKAPVTKFKALTVFFKVSCEEVARPSI